MSTQRRILVTGATGKQGGETIKALLQSPEASTLKIYALTRNPESGSAKALAAKSENIKVVKGDLDDAQAVFKEVGEPVDAVFAVLLPNMKKDSQSVEIKQGVDLIDAAIENNVKHFVYSSVDRHGAQSDHEPTYVPHFISKHRVEQHLKKKASETDNFTWTILRPVAFMDMLEPGMMGKMMATWWSQLGTTKLQFVSTRDIGIIAAKALLKPDEFRNRAISLAGDNLTQAEGNAIYKKLYGRNMGTTFSLLTGAVTWMVEDLGLMWKWFKEVEYDASIEECRKIHPEMQDLETWYKESSSHKA